jgi:hypothetical protein
MYRVVSSESIQQRAGHDRCCAVPDVPLSLRGAGRAAELKGGRFFDAKGVLPGLNTDQIHPAASVSGGERDALDDVGPTCVRCPSRSESESRQAGRLLSVARTGVAVRSRSSVRHQRSRFQSASVPNNALHSDAGAPRRSPRSLLSLGAGERER